MLKYPFVPAGQSWPCSTPTSPLAVVDGNAPWAEASPQFLQRPFFCRSLQVEAEEHQDVVVYDQSTRDVTGLAADSFLSILLGKLDSCFHSVSILTGRSGAARGQAVVTMMVVVMVMMTVVVMVLLLAPEAL